MQGLFSSRAFSGFGPTALVVPNYSPAPGCVLGRKPSILRARVRQQCPRYPGVYGMVDGRGELIYVGKAKCLRTRLLGYFRPRSRDPKAGRIIAEARLLAWEPAPTEFSALLRELELIRRWRPRFNVQGQPKRKRRTLVCLGRRPAPYAFLARRAPASAVAVYGPVPDGHTAREAVRRLNDIFRLRDCPQSQEMVFSDQQELFPVLRAAGCIRHEIGTCLGPCAAACSHAEYEGRLDAARRFLDGADVGPLKELERAMLDASAATQFERAAALRDRLEPLRWLHRSLERLHRARGLSFVYPLQSWTGQELWYVIQGGQVKAVVPAGAAGAATVAARGTDEGNLRAAESVEGLLLVDSWFRKRPEEKARVLTPEQVLAAYTPVRPGSSRV